MSAAMRSRTNDPSPTSVYETMEMQPKNKEKEQGRYAVTIWGRTFNSVMLMVHFNIFLYAMCFWIQTGTLPVSMLNQNYGLESGVESCKVMTYFVVI